MTPKEIIVVGAALVATGAALILDTKDVTETAPSQVQKELVSTEKLSRLPDGGKAYLREVVQKDGGAGLVVKTAPACKRKSGPACTLLDGGNPGTANRLSAASLAGKDCQPVACSVFAGENADEDEQVHLDRKAAP